MTLHDVLIVDMYDSIDVFDDNLALNPDTHIALTAESPAGTPVSEDSETKKV